MNCSLSESALRKLRQKVYKNLTTKVENGEKINLKDYIKSVYDLVYSKNESTTQALDAARVIPMFINQLQGVDNNLRKALGRDNLMETLDLIDQFEDNEKALKNVHDYLGIAKKKVSEKLDALNKSNQLSLPFEEATTEVDPTEASITTEGSKLRITTREYDNIPVKVIKNNGYQLSGDWGSHTVKLERLDNGEYITVDLESINYPYNIQALSKEEITELENRGKTSQQKRKSADEILEEEAAERRAGIDEWTEQRREESTADETKVSKSATAETKETPVETPVQSTPVNPKKPNAIANLTDKLRNAITEFWGFAARVPFFFSSTGREASYSSKDADFRVPYEETTFEYGVQRKLIELFYGDTESITSESLVLDGVANGVFIKAVRASESQNNKETAGFDKDAVILQITDRFGQPIKFTKDFTATLGDGNIVEFPLRSPEKLKAGDIDKMAAALHNYKYPNQRIDKKSQQYAAVKEEVKNQIKQVNDVREYLTKNPNENLLFTIDGGSMGFIQQSNVATTKVGEVNETLKFEIFDITDPVTGVTAGTTYVTAEGLYGQQIQLERPGVKESSDLELIKQLLFEEVNYATGNKVSVEDRENILQNYIDAKGENTTGNNPRVQVVPDANNPMGYKLLMTTTNAAGQKTTEFFDVSNPQQKEAAQKAFDALLDETKTYEKNIFGAEAKLAIEKGAITEATNDKSATPNQVYKNKENANYTKVGYAFKSNTNKGAINSGTINTATIQKAADGSLILTKKNVPVQDFMASQKFEISTPELAADGKLRRTNSYFTFQLTDSASDKLSGKTPAQEAVKEQEIKERNDSVNTDAEEQGHDSESKPKNKTDRFNDLFDDTDELMRSLDQAKMTKKQIQQKIDEAREWYEKSPLNKYFPFEVMFDKINKKGVAQWTMAGVTLFKGSDFTDLYHEAWHGFTQGFMTKNQKIELYDEVRNKRGTFTDYNGKQTTFNDASDRQIEEYLAEEFRSYMLNGGKEGKKKLTSKTKSFFQKILNILEYLFTDSSYNDVYLNPQADTKVNELFEKLRLGNLTDYTFSYENAMFGKLNAGITALKDIKGVNQLNYQDSMDINEMIDYYIADYAMLRSSTKKDREELVEIESDLRKPGITQKERAELLARQEALRSNTQYLGAVTQSKEEMQRAYQWAKSELSVLKDDINQQYLAETNENKKARLFKQKQTLEFALEHFGDTTDLNNNMSKDSDIVRGVIGYHMKKTALFAAEDVTESTGDLYSKSGNELSLQEMARPEIIFLLKSLPDVKNGIEAKNKYGVTKLAAFNATWNRLARTLQNTNSIDEMYKRLNDLAKDYEPIKHLLRRLGDPQSAKLISEVNLQSTFFQTFAKTRVPLVQMTLVKEGAAYNARVGEAFNSDYAVGRKWQNDLSTAVPNTNDYILTDSKGKNYVNIKKILADFSEADARANRIAFYNALGFKLTDTKEIKRDINQSQYDPVYFHRALVEINKSNKRLYDYKDITEDESVKYKALMNLEAKYSDVFSNFAVTNAEGNMQFEHTLNNSMTIMINSINNANSYQELVSQPHMEHLRIDGNNANPFAQASVWMKSLYDLEGTAESNPNWGQPRVNPKTGERVTLKLMNLSGILVQESGDETGDGISSASADKVTKILMDLHLAQAGGFELMRHADKGTSYAVKIDGPIYGNTNALDSYIPMSAFAYESAYHQLTYERVLPHLIAEMKRMREMSRLADDVNKGEAVEYDYAYIKKGQEFITFDNVLKSSSTLKADLKKIIAGTEDIQTAIQNNPDIQREINNNFKEYFNKQFEQMNADVAKTEFIADNMFKNISDRNPQLKGKEREALIRSFVHNNWIHNIESVALLYGDIAQYNMAKEEFHKRNAGIGSTGTIYRTDIGIQNYINNNLWESSYAKKLGLAKHEFNGQFNTAILEDMSIKSAYFDEYVKQLGPEAAAAYGLNKKGKGQNEADAQGFITFDSYRQLKVAEGTWSNAQEKLYRDVVNGKKITPNDLTKFFPVVKAQYWGPLAQKTSIPLTAFHKYSLFPLIPGVVEGTNAEAIHQKMMKEGIDYLTFESGSKVGNITKSGNVETGERNFDKAYSNQTTRTLAEGILTDQTDENGKPIPYFTKNTIHLQYLKNQLRVHEEPKGKVIFSTQLRKLVEDGLMENGVPIDYLNAGGTKEQWDSLKSDKAKEAKSDYYKMLRTYERNLAKLTNIAKEDLLQEMGWESNVVDGQEQLTGDIKSLISFVQKELTRQDLAQHEIDFLQFDENGKLKHDLSQHTSVEKIEKLLNALMVKKLVKQKVNGEGLIQVASTFLEKAGLAEGRNFTNPTAEDLATYGSNDLPFYRKGKGPDGKTSAMKVKVSLQGDFVNLLKLKDKEGQVIGTRKRLNELIKDEEWLNTGRNREMLTMIAVRIPVQGLNSMEFMEVYEFLDPSAGSVIVPPTEIVTKSGADFDVDKMTVMMPNIRKAKYKKNEFGIAEQVSEPQMWNWTEQELKEAYDDYLALQKEIVKGGEDAATDDLLMSIFGTMDVDQMVEEEIKELQKEGKVMDFPAFKKKRMGSKAVQNDIIKNITDILSLSTNFNALLTPNSTDLLDPISDTFRESAMDFNPKERLYGEGVNKEISGTRVLEYRYNLYKHQSNKVGKEALGLGAVDNTYNTLFNRIGAYMNATTVPLDEFNRAQNLLNQKDAIKDIVKRQEFVKKNKEALDAAQKTVNKFERQTILLDHNTMEMNGETVISLSHTTSKGTNVKISDLINQMINGWVDVAKDAWIFNIQGNKEVAPTLLFMVQAGVPIRDAVAMASSPLVKEYIKQQQLLKSTFVNPLGMDLADPSLYRVQAKQNILSKPEFGFNVELNQYGNISNATVKELTQNMLSGVKKFEADELLEGTKKHSTALKNNEQYQYSELDKQAFLHYLQLENMGKSVRDVKMRTNVDTSRDESLFAAQDRLGMLQALREDGRLPESIVDKIMTESPISSFFIQGFQINLLGRLFPLRNHKEINQFARKNVDKNLQDATYGDKEATVSNWKSDLINFIFQNELKYFDINKISNYRSTSLKQDIKLEPSKLQFGAYVKEGVMYIDKNRLIEQFNNGEYAKLAYLKELGLAPVTGANVFNDANEYIHFVLERESLRAQKPINTVKDTVMFNYYIDEYKNFSPQTENESSPAYDKRVYKAAYEFYLRDEAMANIHNFNYMFKHTSANFANKFLKIKNAYPDLAKTFDIMNALSTTDEKGIKNIMLNESKLSADQKNILNENLAKLSDVNELKEVLPDTSLEQRGEIADFFKSFSTYAFLQSGLNVRSKYSLNQFVSQDTMLGVLSKPTKEMLSKLDNNPAELSEFMNLYTDLFKALNKSQDRKTRIRGKNYFRNITLSDLRSIAEAKKSLKPEMLIEGFNTTQPTQSSTSVNTEWYDKFWGYVNKGFYQQFIRDLEKTKNASEIETINKEIRNVYIQKLKSDYPQLGAITLGADNSTLTVENKDVLKELEPTISRLMVGNHGIYIEFTEPTNKGKFVKKRKQYNEYNRDGIKLYEQFDTVNYADYKVGKWYADINDYKLTTQPSTISSEELEIIERDRKYDLKRGSMLGSDGFRYDRSKEEINAFYDNEILNAKLSTQSSTSVKGFQGYKGEFEDKGKGTPEGDGKDKAMRAVAGGFILELDPKRENDSSTGTTAKEYPNYREGVMVSSKNFYNSVVMLARNNEFKNKPLSEDTKVSISDAHSEGVSFVVGDMPGVDSQFIDYLQEIGAKFTVYHTGATSRIKVKETTQVGNVEYTARTYSADRLKSINSVKDLNIAANSGTTYIYNGPIENIGAPREKDQFLHNAAPNTIGLPSKQMYSQQSTEQPVRADIIRDVEGRVNPQAKGAIDNAIQNIKEHIAQGQEIAFSDQGYGQDMLETNKAGNQYAPETFLYLSEQLYNNFGYINPGYLSNNPNILDLEIAEALDQQVIEFMKNCI